MRILKITAAALVLSGPFAAPLTAAEPEQGKPEAQKMSPEEQKANYQRGVKILSLFNSALSNKDVPDDQKGVLFTCIYGNPLYKISIATGKILEKNPKLDAANNTHLYQVAATVCGVNKTASMQESQKTK